MLKHADGNEDNLQAVGPGAVSEGLRFRVWGLGLECGRVGKQNGKCCLGGLVSECMKRMETTLMETHMDPQTKHELKPRVIWGIQQGNGNEDYALNPKPLNPTPLTFLELGTEGWRIFPNITGILSPFTVTAFPPTPTAPPQALHPKPYTIKPTP